MQRSPSRTSLARASTTDGTWNWFTSLGEWYLPPRSTVPCRAGEVRPLHHMYLAIHHARLLPSTHLSSCSVVLVEYHCSVAEVCRAFSGRLSRAQGVSGVVRAEAAGVREAHDVQRVRERGEPDQAVAEERARAGDRSFRDEHGNAEEPRAEPTSRMSLKTRQRCSDRL